MKILKRIMAILFIFLFLLSPVGLNMVCPVPTYAADEWEDVTKADLVTAFKYYCKSRNLAIEGSLADALTTFTTDTFNNLVNTLGIDSDAIQAELKKTTQGNLGLRFLFTQTGVNFYNRIFAEFLQNNDLAVGDTVDNKELWSGQSYNGSIIWECTDVLATDNNWNSVVIKQGSYYKYTSAQLSSMSSGSSVPFTEFNVSYPLFSGQRGSVGNINSSNGVALYKGSLNNWVIYNYGVSGSYVFLNVEYHILEGYPILVHVNGSDNPYNLCFYQKTDQQDNGRARSIKHFSSVTFPDNEQPENENVYVTTNNTTINNNDYSKDYTIIYNDGDYYDIDHNYPSPDTPPDGGGGGGGDNPDTPTPPDPPSSTPPDWPIELPDTDIDWIIRGMEERFPWDIPFNVMFALSLLNAEPETPHFEGTIDLKVVQWDYDIDLEPFDQIAEYFRKFFFFSFLVWLLLVTKKLIWG